MKRTLGSIVLGVILTGMFVSGLAWMTRIRERQWSDDPEIRRKQVVLVAAVVGGILLVSGINFILNDPTLRALRDRGRGRR
jgi:multidrug resistance efflux pump